MADNKPTHQAYLVEDKGEGNDAFWRPVAPLWSHRDQKGLDLIIPAGMALTGRIVIREITDQADRPEARADNRRASRSEPRR